MWVGGEYVGKNRWVVIHVLGTESRLSEKFHGLQERGGWGEGEGEERGRESGIARESARAKEKC